MQYKVRSKRLETGQYELSYGKGKGKLTATVWYNDLAKEWVIHKGAGANHVNTRGPFVKKKDAVEAWAVWAEREWGSKAAESSGPKQQGGQPDEPRSAPPRKGPPKKKPRIPSRPLPPKHVPKPPQPTEDGKQPENLDFQFGSDPFDGRFKYPTDHPRPGLRKKHTPLGVLIEIEKWVQRNEREIKSSPSFQPLISSVRACISREAPDLVKKG